MFEVPTPVACKLQFKVTLLALIWIEFPLPRMEYDTEVQLPMLLLVSPR